MRREVLTTTVASEAVKGFLDLVDKLPELSVLPSQLWSHKHTCSPQTMAKRSEFYITKEIESLKRLRTNGVMRSEFQIESKEDFGNAAARISFFLGDDESGYTIYEYVVFSTRSGWLIPKLSKHELAAYYLKKVWSSLSSVWSSAVSSAD